MIASTRMLTLTGLCALVALPVITSYSIHYTKLYERDDLHEVNRDELDRILDKIGATGLSSLTQSEREFLDRFSTRH